MSSNSKAATFRAISHARRSCKRFQPDRSVPDEILCDILESTMRSPSSFNLQPTQIIMVSSKSVKEEIAKYAMLGNHNQYRCNDASAIAVFCSDLHATKRIQRIYELEKSENDKILQQEENSNKFIRHPNYLNSMPLATSFLLGEGYIATKMKNIVTDYMSQVQPMPQIDPVLAWSYKNTALLVQSYVLAATSYDLSTCIMEGFDARRLKKILRIPTSDSESANNDSLPSSSITNYRYEIPMIVATGYEYNEKNDQSNQNQNDAMFTPRLRMDEVVFGETFGQPWIPNDKNSN